MDENIKERLENAGLTIEDVDHATSEEIEELLELLDKS